MILHAMFFGEKETLQEDRQSISKNQLLSNAYRKLKWTLTKVKKHLASFALTVIHHTALNITEFT